MGVWRRFRPVVAVSHHQPLPVNHCNHWGFRGAGSPRRTLSYRSTGAAVATGYQNSLGLAGVFWLTLSAGGWSEALCRSWDRLSRSHLQHDPSGPVTPATPWSRLSRHAGGGPRGGGAIRPVTIPGLPLRRSCVSAVPMPLLPCARLPMRASSLLGEPVAGSGPRRMAGTSSSFATARASPAQRRCGWPADAIAAGPVWG